METDRLKESLASHQALLGRMGNRIPEVIEAARALFRTLERGNKILICGNGGSAADSQHFAAEVVGRFSVDRRAFPAMALTTDTSILTAVGNDYGFDSVFRRQVEGLGVKGDTLVAISTSGNSPNVLAAIEAASALGMTSIALTGKGGGRMVGCSDLSVIVPSDSTQEIQLTHLWTLHQWVELIEVWYNIGQ